MEPAASPAKRARRTALQRAAAGSMDIRECFRESAAAAASPRPASTVLPDLSAAQVRVLMTWTFAAALAARDAWARFQASDGPLLFQANLQLLPPSTSTWRSTSVCRWTTKVVARWRT